MKAEQLIGVTALCLAILLVWLVVWNVGLAIA